MKKEKFLIFTGGTLQEKLIRSCMEQYQPDQVICVDGALHVLDRLSILPDYIVGDYDTVDAGLIDRYRQEAREGRIQTQIRTFCPEKDSTDTHIAISLAIECNAGMICILGATGTRADHMLANIHMLMLPLSAKVPAYIVDEHNKMYLIDQPCKIEKSSLYGPYISLIPLGGDILNVTLKGFKYETDQVDFLMGDSLGVSNELLEETGSIEYEQGVFLVIEAKD